MNHDEINKVLLDRGNGGCELCGSTNTPSSLEVKGGELSDAECCIFACQTCSSQIQGTVAVDSKHWYCLKEAMWSEVAAVQVSSFRMLKTLESEGWAQDLLGQIYLAEEVQAWADNPELAEKEEEIVTFDSNGATLSEGDSVTLIQDLPVKGAGFTAKRGTMVKNIHLIGDPENIEGRINKMTLVLKTKFLKKV